MKWYNAKKDRLPENKQRVLVSVKGVYFLCTYNVRKKLFCVEDPGRSVQFSPDEPELYWSEYIPEMSAEDEEE
jgi:hypothetical protein